MDKIYQLVVIKSRPTKKKVSFHSTFSNVASGVYLAAVFPFISPGVDAGGLPRIFTLDSNLAAGAALQLQAAIAVMAATGFMGYFRFPPKTPPSRLRIFETAAATCLYMASFASSSLNGRIDGWWFDAFSFPGNAVMAASGILLWVSSLRLLDDAVSGSTRGRATIPGAASALTATFQYSILYLLAFAVLVPIIPILTSDSAAFEASVSKVLGDCGANGALIGVAFTAVGQSAFGSLLATLQFERKISQTTGSVIANAMLVALNLDFSVFLIHASASPEFAKTAQYFSDQLSQSHAVEVAVFAAVSVILNAFRKNTVGIENI